MKKILFLANLNPNKFGSMEEHVLFLCKEVTRRGHQFFSGFVAEPLPEIRMKLEDAGARILTVYCGDTPIIGNYSQFNFKEMFSLYRIIKENNIDLIHVSFIGLTNPSIMAMYLTGVKIVFTEQASGMPFRRNNFKNIISKIIHYFISKRISKYIGISDYVSKRFRETHHVAGDKVVTIYNSVNINRFKPRDISNARQELGLPLDRKILCSVAMLIPEKGIHYLLQAVAQLVNDYGIKGLLLVIVGEGYYRKELENLIELLKIKDYVLLLGRRSDVQVIIAAADVVVVPSLWEEAFGIIIAEAMASARPVVASATGGIPELVDHGVTGLLVPSGDTPDLTAALLSLLTRPDECSRMGEAGLEKAIAKFSVAKQVGRLADLYDGILKTTAI